MRVDLDAQVTTRDGEEIGSIGRAIFDPGRNEMTHVVVNTGALFGRDVLVPAEELAGATRDGNTVRLRLSKEEFEELPTYAPSDYLAPPPGWTPPSTYGLGYRHFLWPTMAMPQPGAAGYPYAGAGAGVGTGPDSQLQPTLGKGDTVVDINGEELGVVDDVVIDQASGELEAMVVRIGNAIERIFGTGDTVRVKQRAIESVIEGKVRLAVPKDRLKELLET